MISWLERNKKVSWTITIIIFLIIFYLSSRKFAPSIGVSLNILAILYHISIFFLLAIFLLISVLERKWEFKKIVSSILIVTIYAGLDELHQYFVPGRFTSFSDFLLDFNGIIFASLIYLILIEIKNQES